MTAPLLVTVAHGTRNPVGNDVARALTHAAGERLGWPAVASYVELCEPSFTSVVAGADRPVVAVPLLLSTGYHVRHDLPASMAEASVEVSLGTPLGPHPLLARAMAERLVEAGARPGTRAVLVGAGSRDHSALRDLRLAARLLRHVWGAPVRVATLGGLGPRPTDVVQPGDVVAPYLLAPGFFADRCREDSLAAGARLVADVIGPHDLVAERVVRQARARGQDRLTA